MVFLTSFIVVMVTCNIKKIIITCSRDLAFVRYSSVFSTEKESLYWSVRVEC